jgi:hypothetical protein
MAQVVQHLPRKHKALSSNPSTGKINKSHIYVYIRINIYVCIYTYMNKIGQRIRQVLAD